MDGLRGVALSLLHWSRLTTRMLLWNDNLFIIGVKIKNYFVLYFTFRIPILPSKISAKFCNKTRLRSIIRAYIASLSVHYSQCLTSFNLNYNATVQLVLA